MSHCWQKTLITGNCTIKHALEIINNEGLHVAIVIDGEKRLLGMVTDGDIRRGLLSDLSLSDSVDTVMNSSPVTVKHGTSKEQLVDLMEEKQILSIPILNDLGQIVGLETLHSALIKKKFQHPVFIMAGGFGTRLKPLTDSCPKPMLQVGAKPILETVIDGFIKSGFVNFYISTHYMPELIKSHFGSGEHLGINITYVHEEKPLGTGGALGLVKEHLNNTLPLIMINGDVLTNVDYKSLLEFHIENKADATMCVREYTYQVPYGVIEGCDGRIKSMVEKPIYRFFVNAGIYVVSQSVIHSVKKNEYIDMPTLLERHMEQKDNIHMFPVHEYWLDIGRMDDFNRAQVDIKTLEL